MMKGARNDSYGSWYGKSALFLIVYWMSHEILFVKLSLLIFFNINIHRLHSKENG